MCGRISWTVGLNLVNAAVGAMVGFQGVMTLLSHESFVSIILELFVVFIGIVIVALEIVELPKLQSEFEFYFHYAGRGVFFIL